MKDEDFTEYTEFRILESMKQAQSKFEDERKSVMNSTSHWDDWLYGDERDPVIVNVYQGVWRW